MFCCAFVWSLVFKWSNSHKTTFILHSLSSFTTSSLWNDVLLFQSTILLTLSLPFFRPEQIQIWVSTINFPQDLHQNNLIHTLCSTLTIFRFILNVLRSKTTANFSQNRSLFFSFRPPGPIFRRICRAGPKNFEIAITLARRGDWIFSWCQSIRSPKKPHSRSKWGSNSPSSKSYGHFTNF